MVDENRDRSGKIVQTLKDGIPILWTLMPELPPESVRSALPWLTVISWRYDASSRNGMPPTEVNSEIMVLDRALGDLERPGFCVEAYRRIGNDLREFVLYISDQESYMSELNRSLASHPRYPIEIKFYEDASWSELQQLIDDLFPTSSAAGSGVHGQSA